MEINAEPFQIESSKSQIHIIEETSQWLKQGIGSFDNVTIEDCQQQMTNCRKKVDNLGALNINQRGRKQDT